MNNRDSAIRIVFIMILLTFGSKILGFVREVMLAAFFGTSYIVDSYVMAYSIPNILFAAFFVSIGTAYIPIMSSKVEEEGNGAGRTFTTQMIVIVSVLSLITVLIGLVFSKQIISIMAYGFDIKAKELTNYYYKVALFFSFFTAIITIFENYLQYHNVFAPQIVIDYIQNVFVIIAIIISAKYDYRFLIYGLLFGYGFRLILLYYCSKKNNYKFEFTPCDLKKTILILTPIALPVFLGTISHEINVFVDRTCASFLQEGSIASLNYANQVSSILLTLTAAILSTVLYPKISRACAKKNYKTATDLLNKGISFLIVIIVPIVLMIISFNNEIVDILYGRGAFGEKAVLTTSSCLSFYVIGVLFTGLNDLIIKSFYALKESKIPMKCSMIAMIINILLNVILSLRIGVSGLALATSISSAANTIMLVCSFNIKYGEIKKINVNKKILKIVLYAMFTILFSRIVYSFLIENFISSRFLRMLLISVIIVILYTIILITFKNEEIIQVLNVIKDRFHKKK